MNKISDAVVALYRLFLFVVIIGTFLVTSFVIHLFVRNPDKRLRIFPKNASRYCRALLWALNLKLKVVNKPTGDKKFLLVSNHMGFVDIFMLASTIPMVFVTSNEMRETPLLGTLVEMGGSMFVERRNRSKILQEMQAIAEVLKAGHRVTLYPEATSTDGAQVYPFKRTLIMSAAHAGVPIQPVVINYRKINGEPFSLKWRDHVCWYGETTFVQAFWKTLSLRSIEGEVEFLPSFLSDASEDRAVVADKAHDLIAAKYVPPTV